MTWSKRGIAGAGGGGDVSGCTGRGDSTVVWTGSATGRFVPRRGTTKRDGGSGGVGGSTGRLTGTAGTEGRSVGSSIFSFGGDHCVTGADRSWRNVLGGITTGGSVTVGRAGKSGAVMFDGGAAGLGGGGEARSGAIGGVIGGGGGMLFDVGGTGGGGRSAGGCIPPAGITGRRSGGRFGNAGGGTSSCCVGRAFGSEVSERAGRAGSDDFFRSDLGGSRSMVPSVMTGKSGPLPAMSGGTIGRGRGESWASAK